MLLRPYLPVFDTALLGAGGRGGALSLLDTALLGGGGVELFHTCG